MKVTIFNNARCTQGRSHSFPWSTICKYKHKLLTEKDSFMWAFKYYEGDSRARESKVLQCTAVLLDFDNKDLSTPTTWEDVAPEIEDYKFYAYSTHGDNPLIPKWRLIVPLPNGEYFRPESYKEAYDELVTAIGNPPGLDHSMRNNMNLAVYMPATFSDNPDDYWVRHNQDGPYFPWDTPTIVNGKDSKKEGPGGRNDLLGEQAEACYHKGKSIETAAEEILLYDITYHEPPLFEDRSENIKGDTPEAKALNFAASHYQTQKKLGPPNNLPPKIEIRDDLPNEDAAPSWEIPEHILTNAPGPVGELANWITEYAYMPQPAYSLGAALSVFSIAKAHVTKLGRSTYPALLILNVGKTSTGKNWPLECVYKILNAAGMHSLVHGRPASAEGLEELIIKEKTALCAIDEFGATLSSMIGENASSHAQTLPGRIMEIWSATNRVYTARRRAADEQTRRVTQPFLSFFCTATPEHLYKLLADAEVVSGFVPRWLFFMSPENDPSRNRGLPDNIPMPDNVIKALKSLPRPGYELGEPIFQDRKKLDKQALDFQYAEEDRLAQLAKDKGDDNPTRAMYGKAIENTLRVCSAIEMSPIVKLSTIEWAHKITTSAVDATLYHLEREGGENEYDANCNKIITAIEKAGKEGIMHRALSNRKSIKKIQIRNRAEILKDLFEEKGIVRRISVGRTFKYIHSKYVKDSSI